MSEELEWPSDFPEYIPPPDAIAAENYAYRLVRNNPPLANDFLPYKKELNNIKKFENKVGLAANVYGTSMFRSLEKIKIIKEIYKPQRDKIIAHGLLIPSYGKMSAENLDTHFDVWLSVDTGIEQSFSVVPM